MIFCRPVKKDDLEDLYELSSFHNFINLPHNKEILEELIASSIKTFKSPSPQLDKNKYLFILEDSSISQVIGTSMIHAQHGTKDSPHFYLQLGQEERFSSSINRGFIYGTLKLGYETDGPTEIGGLILHPRYRSMPNKLGKQLSFIRFLYLAIYPSEFKKSIHSELLPPFDQDGNSPLWEALGRKFLNMNYQDADLLSQKNKEFILTLFPQKIIYEALLPMGARSSIGEVGKKTLPVKKMLTSIGFKFINQIDPFDGGPHYRCNQDDLKPIKETAISAIDFKQYKDTSLYLLLLNSTKNNFKSVAVMGKRKNNHLYLDSRHKNDLLEYQHKSLYNMPL